MSTAHRRDAFSKKISTLAGCWHPLVSKMGDMLGPKNVCLAEGSSAWFGVDGCFGRPLVAFGLSWSPLDLACIGPPLTSLRPPVRLSWPPLASLGPPFGLPWSPFGPLGSPGLPLGSRSLCLASLWHPCGHPWAAFGFCWPLFSLPGGRLASLLAPLGASVAPLSVSCHVFSLSFSGFSWRVFSFFSGRVSERPEA